MSSSSRSNVRATEMLRDAWINGDFSKSFGDGYKYRFTGFNCSRTTSNVHRSLDG